MGSYYFAKSTLVIGGVFCLKVYNINRKELLKMKLRKWNTIQITESKSKENRYFFWLKYRREAYNDSELLIFYIQNGGAEQFAKNHRKELDETED